MAIKRGTSLLFLGALSSGAGAAYFTDYYIDSEVSAYRRDIEKDYQPVDVVVPKVALRPGEALSIDKLAKRPMPRKFVHSDAIRPDDVAGLEGHRATASVNSGEPLLLSHISKRRGSSFSSLIGDGERALTFPVDIESSMTGMLRPGDRIDLLMTLRDDKETVTVPLKKNVEIMATGPVVDELVQSEKGYRYQTITLLVDTADAAQITHARQVGTLTVTLRSPADANTDFSHRVTLDSLLGKVAAKKKKRTAPPRVDVIIGGVN